MLALFPKVEDTKKDRFCFLHIQEKINVSSREHVQCTIKFFPLPKWGKTKMSLFICFAPFR